MIAFLDGNIILKKDKFIILEVNGIGYKVFLSHQTLSRLPENNGQINSSNSLRVKLFCYHNIKEDASDLYGFFTYDELEFFEILMDIRGVGPKAALEISILGPLDRIKQKILAQDESVFSGIHGIGEKKAKTIILELTGKINSFIRSKSSSDEAESALTQLGFTKQQAKDALSKVPLSIKNSEERIKEALKNLGKN